MAGSDGFALFVLVMLVFLLFGLVVGVEGVTLLVYAFRRSLRGGTRPIREVVDGASARIHGRVRTPEGRLTAPFSGEECVAVAYRVTKLAGEDHHTILKGEEQVSFLVEDDTGVVGVDPGDAQLFETRFKETCGPGAETPAWFERLRRADPDDPGQVVPDLEGIEPGDGSEYTFHERRVDATDAYVAGTVTTDPAVTGSFGRVDAVIGAGGGSQPVRVLRGRLLGEPFVVTNGDSPDATRKAFKGGLLWTVVATVLVGIPVGLVVL